MRRRRLIALLPALAAGCTTLFQTPFEQAWRARGWRARVIRSDPFRHLLLFNDATRTRPLQWLDVYLDGDGRPWLGRGRPARDPTPHNPLVIQLMALDPHPAVYLGRPCYGGLHPDPECHPWFWTQGRYGQAVVNSLAGALQQVLGRYPPQHLRLIGYSGGGTLAMLLAARLPSVDAVVTLAGNLDPAGWTGLHGYTPLAEAPVPPPLPTRICQWHWAGAQDREVPPTLIRAALQAGSQVHFEVLPGVDHRHGWVERWPQLLRRMERGCGPTQA